MYYGELGRIERNYGSVAEYNRCRDEEDFYYGSCFGEDDFVPIAPPTEEELKKIAMEEEEFNRKAKKANGIPSNMAKMFHQNMIATSNFSEEIFLKAVKKLNEHYGIQFVECENPDEVGEHIVDRYGICISFHSDGMLYERNFIVNNLDFVKFCDIYRDANHIGFICQLYMFDRNHNNFDIVCGDSTLGEILVEFGYAFPKYMCSKVNQ